MEAWSNIEEIEEPAIATATRPNNSFPWPIGSTTNTTKNDTKSVEFLTSFVRVAETTGWNWIVYWTNWMNLKMDGGGGQWPTWVEKEKWKKQK